MTPLEVGYEVDVIDEAQPVVAPTATDTCFLVHSADDGPALQKITSPAEAREHYPNEPELLANIDALFGEGAARVYVSVLDTGDNADVQDALDRFEADLGPGQVVAPEVVTADDLVAIAEWAWQTNRIAILNGPDGANEAALIALKDAVKSSSGGRFASLEADTMIIPGAASSQTREVSAAVVKAGLIARNDIATGNPNLAAAGVQGQCLYSLGIKAERTDAERQALAAEQVNTFKTVFGQALRAYGYLTLADLTKFPHWWDLSGSRTIMAVRAREAAVAEDHLFGQIDGQGKFLAQYEGALRGELADLARLGAIYHSDEQPGYRVDVSPNVNPIEQLAQGRVSAQIVVKTSPHARALSIQIIRRPITQEV